MIVFRLCDKNEVDLILNDKKMYKLGKCFENDEKLNNFMYDKNEKYLHFFEKFYSLLYLGLTINKYICEYDIPDYILEKCKGKGKYLDFIDFKRLETANEFAIKSILIKFDYLLKIDKIIEFIDYDNFVFEEINNYLENIYTKENFKNF